jgi:tRNA 2-thiouridine synthesizing protein A
VLRVVADDPAAVVDMPHFCAGAGHELLAREELGGSCRAWLIRAQARPMKSSAV